MPKYQIPTLDFEAVAAMDDDARTAALDAYRAEVAALGDALAADEQSDADRQSALAAARYDAAKYKLASDKSCAGFADAMDEIETVLAETPALAAMPDEERLRTAYYIVRGKRPAPAPAPEPSAEELFAALEKNPPRGGADAGDARRRQRTRAHVKCRERLCPRHRPRKAEDH